ncbi:MAG: thioredoxin-disulfide reductase [Puniceicoccales bacterium]|jgi:thioredoxin reductase (NADPH)|nr:thioredoxin-disulfide reductase [Puniceicoccales bacterium]
MEELVIIGSGCAGLTAAIYAARAGLNPLVMEGEQPGGQLITTAYVENFPGFPKGISGYDLVANMRQQAERFGARFLSDNVEKVSFEDRGKGLICRAEGEMFSNAIIVATGTAPRKLEIPGEERFYGGKGVSACAICDGAFYRGQDVAVIGGGDVACEDALFLTRFASRVYLIHRRDQLRASKIMAERVINHENIRCLWKYRPIRIDGVNNIESLWLQHVDTQEIISLRCSGIFLAIGRVPNTSIFRGVLPLDEQGYTQRTGVSIPGHSEYLSGVFVAGDCADPSYRQAVVAAGMGCQAAITAERYLSERSYGA